MIHSLLIDKIFQRGTGVSLQEIENLYTLQVWEVFLRLLEGSQDTYPMELIEQAEAIVSKFNEWDSERESAL
jgi:hypothetical protein